jgi:hypothetical protein
MNKIFYFLIIIVISIVIYNFNFKKMKELNTMESHRDFFLPGPNFINLNKYLFEENILMKNKEFILNDLNNILDNNKDWTIWDYSDNPNDKNNFSKLSNNEILKRLEKKKNNPKRIKNTWTIFGLILNKKTITKEKNMLRNTLNILNKIPNVINAGFSCLTPNSSTDVHNENDKGFYRIHLPLIIPKGDCAIQVQDEIKKWYDCSSIMILDDTKWHNAWNYTKYPRYILIIDVLKK